jgi:hypothetical protein
MTERGLTHMRPGASRSTSLCRASENTPHSGTSGNAPSETVWKIVRVVSGPYFSPRHGGKTGVFALLVTHGGASMGSIRNFQTVSLGSTLAIFEQKR